MVLEVQCAPRSAIRGTFYFLQSECCTVGKLRIPVKFQCVAENVIGQKIQMTVRFTGMTATTTTTAATTTTHHHHHYYYYYSQLLLPQGHDHHVHHHYYYHHHHYYYQHYHYYYQHYHPSPTIDNI